MQTHIHSHSCTQARTHIHKTHCMFLWENPKYFYCLVICHTQHYEPKYNFTLKIKSRKWKTIEGDLYSNLIRVFLGPGHGSSQFWRYKIEITMDTMKDSSLPYWCFRHMDLLLLTYFILGTVRAIRVLATLERFKRQPVPI